MRKPTVLVADDDRSMRAALRRRLSALGYRVLEVTDGLQAIRECPKGLADVVILDHGMPNGDGRTVARLIRKESDIPIVFLSGYGCEDFREIVTELRDVYYLSKPVDDEKLAGLLASLVEAPRINAKCQQHGTAAPTR